MGVFQYTEYAPKRDPVDDEEQDAVNRKIKYCGGMSWNSLWTCTRRGGCAHDGDHIAGEFTARKVIARWPNPLSSEHFRTCCRHCGQTGQAHGGSMSCIRFEPETASLYGATRSVAGRHAPAPSAPRDVPVWEQAGFSSQKDYDDYVRWLYDPRAGGG